MLLAAVHQLLECYPTVPTVPTVQMSGVADNHNLHSSGMVVAQCKLSHCNRSPPSTEPTMSLARSRTCFVVVSRRQLSARDTTCLGQSWEAVACLICCTRIRSAYPKHVGHMHSSTACSITRYFCSNLSAAFLLTVLNCWQGTWQLQAGTTLDLIPSQGSMQAGTLCIWNLVWLASA
jgi:hypothetical protein